MLLNKVRYRVIGLDVFVFRSVNRLPWLQCYFCHIQEITFNLLSQLLSK